MCDNFVRTIRICGLKLRGNVLPSVMSLTGDDQLAKIPGSRGRMILGDDYMTDSRALIDGKGELLALPSPLPPDVAVLRRLAASTRRRNSEWIARTND